MKRLFYITIAFIIQFNGTLMFSQNFDINSLELGHGKDRTSSISSGDIDSDVEMLSPNYQVLIVRHLEEINLD